MAAETEMPVTTAMAAHQVGVKPAGGIRTTKDAMKYLVIGSGGREHAFAWKLKQDEPTAEIFIAPGNAGTEDVGTNVPIAVTDLDGLIAWAKKEKPNLTVVGPEAPLCAGVVDRFEEAGLPIFGPNKAAARLEGEFLVRRVLNRHLHHVDDAEHGHVHPPSGKN